MTEIEIKEATLEDAIYCAKAMACIEVCEECRFYGLCHTWCDDVYRIIVDALEEIQQYRAIGTIEEFKALKNKHIGKDNMVISSSDLMTILNSDSEELKKYKEVGTVEEFKALKVKNTPMELDEHNFQDELHHYLCPCCRNIVSCNQNYCEECGQALET